MSAHHSRKIAAHDKVKGHKTIDVQFKRTLHITSAGGFPADTTLMLTFQPISGLPQEAYPVCWKIGTFPAVGPGTMTATYVNQLAFISPQVDAGNLITVSTWVELNVGQETSLQQDGSGVISFTPPAPGETNYLVAENDIGSPQDIGLGFVATEGVPPAPTLLWTDIGYTSKVVAQFTPTLLAYVTSEYQATEVLKGSIESPVIMSQDLSILPEDSYWVFSRDGSGVYHLTRSTKV